MNTKKFSKKVVNVENFESGNQALTIYEIRVHVIRDDKDWTADRYLNKEDAEKAIEYYKKSYALLESPKRYDALVGIARTYEILCQYDDAVEEWENVKENLESEWGMDEGAQVEAVEEEIKRIRGLVRKY